MSVGPRARREARPGWRYELALRIGEGGTATVWLGRRAAELGGLGRLVAVKRAHPHLARDPEARRRLLREAAIASRVIHANVVPVLDVDTPDGELWLVLDYVEGASLADLLEAGDDRAPALEADVAIGVVLDACAGLAAVHDLEDDAGRPLGLLHRDVSPQNVLVGVDGTARVTDFGLAKLAEDLSRASGTFAGKAAYMPPEHVEGAPYDARGEVFAMGVVAWEALAGRRLFRRETDRDTLLRLRERVVPALSSAAPAIGPALDGVLARALDGDPARRFPSVHAFAAALEAAARAAGLVPSRARIAAAVRRIAGPALAERRAALRGEGPPRAAGGATARAEPTRDMARPPAAAPVAAVARPGPATPARPAVRASIALAAVIAIALAGYALVAPSAPAIAPDPPLASAPGATVARAPEPTGAAPEVAAIDAIDPAPPAGSAAAIAPPPRAATTASRAAPERGRRAPANPYR